MYEQEKQRQTHLMILLCYTIYTLALIPHSVFNGWDTGAVALIILGLIGSWVMHITEKMPMATRLWLYITLMMLTFFFYGIHETSIFNLAPVMTALIIVYSPTNDCRFVRVCAISYYLTVFYDLVFVVDASKISIDEAERLGLHFVIVLIAERLIETMIRWRWKDSVLIGEKISLLEENNRRAEDFLANMSHELRTPINAVMGITTVMMKNEEDNEKKKDIHSIQMAGNRLFNQIEDILDFTEIDTGSIIVTEESYSISSLINDFIAKNRMMMNDKGIELIFDIDAKLPSVLVGDEGKIKKIIKHLVDNAVKFTKKGGVYVRVYALHKPYGINLCIKVSDTGVGITGEEMGKIKERFFQANGGRNRKNSGLGLGICIVYGMVSAMNGFMQIESTEGKGTTVSLSIPQKIADKSPCIELNKPDDLCMACYLRQEKYGVPEVRDYYNTMISHMVRELGLTIYRVFYLDELKKLISMYQLTHLVIGKEEYEEAASYYEELDKEIEVIVVAEDHFRLPENSRANLVKKPFYCLPFVNILNSQYSLNAVGYDKGYMVCPGVRVLVVDDEPMNLMVAEGVFRSYQMEVKTAWSGMEAIEICDTEDFDLVFLDHMMPEMDGVETLKRLQKKRTDAQHTPTYIAFTANAVSGAREMFLQEGFDEFISKPIEDQELKRLLRKVLPKTSISYIEVEDKKKKSEKNKNSESKQTEKEQADTTEPIPVDAAEGGADSESEKGMLARLEDKGIHTEAGLVYCRSDEEYYEKVLLLFAESSENKIADLEKFYEKEDYKNYQIAIHALKSSAKTLGADTLSEMAKQAEAAAKNQDGDYIRENHRDIMEKYQYTVRGILEVLEPDKSDEKIVVAGENVSKEELFEHLKELKERLDTFEANEAEEQLVLMREFSYHDTSVSDLLRDVNKDVENFDLMAASEKVDAIINSVEGGEI
ncbi:MAG: response regulator [Lachnospiraceae bacterium]|nr:response regulator [Lachnospiraceae bacterium]